MKKNFFKLLIAIILGLTICFGLNFVVDPYCVFGHFLDYQQLEPNQNYIKMDYLLKSKPKFDGYIFGSSRVGNIPTENIKKYKIYNMTYSEGMPEEWKNNIETLLKNGIKPKIIILGLDDFDFKFSSDSHKNQQMRKSYEFLNNKGSLLKHYILVNPFSKYNLTKIMAIMKKNKNKYFIKNLQENGRLFKEKAFEKEHDILVNSDEHLKKEIFGRINGFGYIEYSENEIKKCFQSLREIEYLCKKDNIELIILFNPIHRTSYKNQYQKDKYAQIREEIKTKFNNIKIYDFTNLCDDDLYWFEISHYTSEIGKKIIDNIFQDEIKI